MGQQGRELLSRNVRQESLADSGRVEREACPNTNVTARVILTLP
jgi:hypothetical protein